MGKYTVGRIAILVISLSLIFTLRMAFAIESATPITVENVAGIRLLHDIELPPINAISWSGDGNSLAVATEDGVWLYNIVDDSLVEIGQRDYADRVSFIGDTSLVAADFDHAAIIFDTATLEPVRELAQGFDALSHDGSLYAVEDSNIIRIFSLDTDELVQEIPVTVDKSCEFSCRIQKIAFSPDGRYIAFSSGVPEVENGIVEIETGQRLASIEMGMQGLVFSADGSILALREAQPGYLSRRVLFTDSSTGHALASIVLYGSGDAPAFSQDDRLLVVGGIDDRAPNPDEALGEVYFFNMEAVLKTGEAYRSQFIHMLSFGGWVTATEFSPDNRYVAVGDDRGRFTIWGIKG